MTADASTPITKGIPVDLRDRTRQQALALTNDDTLRQLHDEVHTTWGEVEDKDTEDPAGWFNTHKRLVDALEARGFEHPPPPSGSGDLDDLGTTQASTGKAACDDKTEGADQGDPPATDVTTTQRPAPNETTEKRRVRSGGHPPINTGEEGAPREARVIVPSPRPLVTFDLATGQYRMAKSIRTQRFFKSDLSDGDGVWCGVVYEPYVLDAHGQWMRRSWIRRACNLWSMYHQGYNDEHEKALPAGEVLPAQNFIAPVTYEDAGETLYIGTWLHYVKLFGETLERAEAGDFTGFSLEGPGYLIDHAQIDYAAVDAALAAGAG